MTKELQFELWQECNSRCTYCSLGPENHHTSDEYKLQSIHTAYDTLEKEVSLEPYDVVGFIGGEFFQGQLNTEIIKNEFLSLMDFVNNLMNRDLIKTVWINATMTIGDQSDLWETLKRFDKLDRVWVLTSWDPIGRFHNPKMVNTWIESISYLHKNFPQVKLNTTTILTGEFIDWYLNDKFDLNNFKQLYNTSMFFKTPVKPDHMCHLTREQINKILGNFFPTQEKFQEFLIKYKSKEGDTAYQNLFSNELKAEEVRKNYNNDNLRNVSFHRGKESYKETLDCDPSLKCIDTLPCGHSCIYQSYVDTDGCSVCDKQLIGGL